MTEETGSFADMFESSHVETSKLEPGQKAEAEVVRVEKEWVFLDIGGKSEGALACSEILDDDGQPTLKEGDTITAYFLSADQGQMLFTTKMSGAAALAHLEEVYKGGIPIDGEITKEIKGGFDVKIAGSSRGFCPYSQIALRRVSDSSQFVGQVLPFVIIEYKENGRNIILSRRALLEEEQEEKKEALKEKLQVGDIVTGTITSIQNFGAFVDIGGIEGLIPVSEISWGRVADIRATLEEGQSVEVSVMKLDWKANRFSFSLKATLADPWESVESQFKEGQCLTGVVVRIADFGAFVNLAPGIDGLVHISNLGAGRRINHPREVVGDGQELEIRIDQIDAENKRISLSIPEMERKREEIINKKRAAKQKEPDLREEFDRFSKDKKEPGGGMGTFADLLKGKK
ncbi:MAG: 30S ribosomal protein S1 [Thermodesulfobacteriota bacterium]